MTTNFEMVKEFNNSMGVKRGLDASNIHLRMDLIAEEFTEVNDEVYYFDEDVGAEELLPNIRKSDLAKELADLLYVVYGAADCFDIDIDKVFKEVHKSNMSKLGDDGKPVYREDGKVMKGPNYQPVQLDFLDQL